MKAILSRCSNGTIVRQYPNKRKPCLAVVATERHGLCVILLLPIEIGRIIFLPVDRCGEGNGTGDVEVVGEGAAVYLFGQAVVAGREVEQADMAIDGG